MAAKREPASRPPGVDARPRVGARARLSRPRAPLRPLQPGAGALDCRCDPPRQPREVRLLAVPPRRESPPDRHVRAGAAGDESRALAAQTGAGAATEVTTSA